MAPAPPEPPVSNLLRLQVVFQGNTNKPEDRYINTWHAAYSSYSAGATDFAAAVRTFYEGGAANTQIGAYMASNINRAYELRAYDLAQVAGNREPTIFAGTLPAARVLTRLPEELAICLSFKAAGAASARRRGRVFLGPFGMDAHESGNATTPPRPNATLITNIVNSAGALLDASVAATSWEWVVYSRKDDTTRNVVSGWVDDAWDIQRRRGHRADNRNPWS